jgi:vitamin B12 transporter
MNRNIFAVCLLGAAGAAFAQDPTVAEQSVVVTASRTAEPLDSTLWSTTVLTRADIEARQAISVQELLAQEAGINIGNNGGLGKLSSVFIRGGESEHTLLLVDGVRVASATAGSAAFEFIPVEQIERIEIVRGPRSTLYGTDAIGGVIQIFTRRAPDADGVNFGGAIGGGSHEAREVGANFQARSGRAWLNLGAESFDTNGFNSCAIGAAAAFAACFVDEPDADGYRSNSGSLAAGYALNDSWNAELHSLIASGKTEYDGSEFAGNQADFMQRVFALSLDGALGRGWHTRVTLGRNQDHQDYLLNGERLAVFGDPASVLDTDRDTASVQLDGALTSALRLVTGVERQRDEVAGDTAYIVNSRTTQGIFGELHARLGAWTALAGGRYEDNEQFGSHKLGNVGVGRALGHDLRMTATWGTAFHAPTFNDLYYPFGAGNPDLVPEESRSFEAGLDGVQQLARVAKSAIPLRWSLHVFQTDIDHLIALDTAFVPANVDEARIRGVELQAQLRSDVWKVGAQYTYLDAVNRGNGNLLPRRAKQNASLELRHIWPSLSVGAVARYEGARFDDLANNRPLGGFVTFDLAAEQKIGRSLAVQARVANLFDRDYSTAAFYLQDGRNYNVTLRYRFAPGQ